MARELWPGRQLARHRGGLHRRGRGDDPLVSWLQGQVRPAGVAPVVCGPALGPRIERHVIIRAEGAAGRGL